MFARHPLVPGAPGRLGALLTLASALACLNAPALADTPPATATEAKPSATATPSGPLSQADAVQWALSRSPALRALQAQAEAASAQARANSRPGLLGLSFTRLRQGDETEIERHLSVGLLDLLVWPLRSAAADRQIALQQQSLALAVLNHAQSVRQQWVQAVSAQARERYQGDVMAAATTAAELARRLHASGQFSAVQRDERAATAARAQLAQAVARNQARREREALVRLIGLAGDEARELRLPDTLPALPAAPRWTAEQVQQAAPERLDLKLAEARWRALRGEAGATLASSLVDVEAGWQRSTSNSGAPAQMGPSLDLKLISVDLGAARRAARQQSELAALANWEQASIQAESQLRERWGELLTAHTTAREATEVLTALRAQVLAEKLKLYNGMLIGPLELLDEARSHRDSVLVAFDALRDYWLADAAMQAAVDGSDAPANASAARPAAAAPANAPATHGGH
ncbi:MAG: hypothetical protein RI907_113 [Pseudomonadota bacterium]|jgi:outer membrane protein TolC